MMLDRTNAAREQAQLAYERTQSQDFIDMHGAQVANALASKIYVMLTALFWIRYKLLCAA